MKVVFSLALMLTSVSGFVQQPMGAMRPNTVLFERPDASAAIAAALEASKKFGPTSAEARVAWDVVEEIDASDNSQATAGTLNDDCLIEEEISKACLDYGAKLDELAGLVQQQQPFIEQMKNLADEMEAIKIAVPKPKAAPDSPKLKAALEAAKKITAEKGITSPEARVAWDEVEEIAAADNSNAVGVRLDEECLVDSAKEACMAIEELNRALSATKDKK